MCVCVPKSIETNTPSMSRGEEQASEESLEAAQLRGKKMNNIDAEVHNVFMMILSDIMIVATRVLGTPQCCVVTRVN